MSAATSAVRQTFREIHGVVVSAGLMQKTVKVRVGGQRWNKQVKKYFNDPKTYLVHDPNSSLRTGDVVAITPGWRTSQHKRHVVKHIIAPAAVPVEERPPVPTEEERTKTREAKKEAKDERRRLRRAEEEGAGWSKRTPPEQAQRVGEEASGLATGAAPTRSPR